MIRINILTQYSSLSCFHKTHNNYTKYYILKNVTDGKCQKLWPGTKSIETEKFTLFSEIMKTGKTVKLD